MLHLRPLPLTRTHGFTRALALTGAALATVAATAAPAATAQASGYRDYVALGDSYASGEAVAPYAAGSDTAINQCHRSTAGAAAKLSWQIAATSYDLAACSGAVTNDLYAPDHNGNKVTASVAEPAQLSHVNAETDVVTLVIGGNDVGFASTLAACVYGDQQRTTRKDCSTNQTLTGAVAMRLEALAGRGTATTPHGLPITPIHQVIRDIRAKAPRAQIILATYPKLVDDTLAAPEIKVGGLTVKEDPSQTMPLYVSQRDAQWFGAVVDQLDQIIINAQARSGVSNVRVTDVRGVFAGHSIGGPGTDWITPVKGTVSAADGSVAMDASTMHPTYQGQQAYYWNFLLNVR